MYIIIHHSETYFDVIWKQQARQGPPKIWVMPLVSEYVSSCSE